MPIRPNLWESVAFFTLNAAPGPILDLGAALVFHTLSTALELDIFEALQERPASAAEVAQAQGLHERGTRHLLEALAAVGYVAERNGRYHNTGMTEKWVLDGRAIDLQAAMTSWGVFMRELWPQAPEIVRSGEREFDFYAFTAGRPGLSHAHQRMMQSSANLVGADIVKKVALPERAGRLLDVGGGHGQFAVAFCRAHPQLRARILDGESALAAARQNVAEAGLAKRIELYAADLWEAKWGTDWDLILLFNLVHHFDLETNARLLEKAHAALRAGGKVAIFDQMAGEVAGSATEALVRLVSFMYYLFADGRTFSREELTSLLGGAGFRNIRFHALRRAPGNGLMVAER